MSPGGPAVNVISAEFVNWKLLIRKPSKLFLRSLLTRLLWKVSSRQVYWQSLQLWWRAKKPWKDHSDHHTNVETRMKGLWIWKSWTYLEEDGARQKSASHQSSEFSNFSICQRESGGRALASVISSDCFSTTHQAAVTAPSGTVNLSLWGFQQRWRPRVMWIKMGHFEVGRCSIN